MRRQVWVERALRYQARKVLSLDEACKRPNARVCAQNSLAVNHLHNGVFATA